MAEETWKTDENAKTPGGTVYHQVAPAGVAAEVTAENPPETTAALGRWLAEKLGTHSEGRERVATLSGISLGDLTSLMEGHPLFRLDTDHVQRIATALVEARIIAQADEVWNAIGSDAGSSEYLLPPMQVVQAMSDNS